MHKTESILQNETHKILWDFEIQTDHQIPAWSVKQKEKNLPFNGFCSSSGPQRENKRKQKKIDKYLYIVRELKKLKNMRGWWYHLHLVRLERFRNVWEGSWRNKKSEDELGPSILEYCWIGHNTEKNPGDLRRLAVTRTPEKNYQIILIWKIHQE